MKLCILILFAFVATIAIAADPSKESPAKIVQGNNEFAFDLCGRLRAESGNFVFSPYSISTALAMTYTGARGDTAEQMAKTMHFPLGPEQLPPVYGKLVNELRGEGGKRPYKLNIANRIWGQKGFGFRPAFLQQLDRDYRAGLEEVDYKESLEKSRQTINAWVAKETEDKIKDLLSPSALTPLTRMVLTNAIFLEASWVEPFHEGNTKEGDFFVAADKKSRASLMHLQLNASYLDGEAFQAIELPYRGGGLSMMVLLPKKVDGIAELEKSLTATKLAEWLPKFKRYQVELTLPKFKMGKSIGLSKELAALGMPKPFSPDADFSGMASAQLKIDNVIHQAFVDVNEKGTVAAAAAVVVALASAAPVNLPKAEFKADHPFVFVLRESRSGSVLFMGRVSQP